MRLVDLTQLTTTRETGSVRSWVTSPLVRFPTSLIAAALDRLLSIAARRVILVVTSECHRCSDRCQWPTELLLMLLLQTFEMAEMESDDDDAR